MHTCHGLIGLCCFLFIWVVFGFDKGLLLENELFWLLVDVAWGLFLHEAPITILSSRGFDTLDGSLRHAISHGAWRLPSKHP